MSDLYRDGPEEHSRLRTGLAKCLTEAEVTRNAANIDRFVAQIISYRADHGIDAMQELATLLRAAELMTEADVKMMFAIMLQRLAEGSGSE